MISVFKPMDWTHLDNILLYSSSQEIVPEFHVHISNCRLDISTSMSKRNLQIHVLKINSYSSFPNLLHGKLSVSVKGKTIHLVAQAETLGVILNAFLSPSCLQLISESCWLYLPNVPQSDHSWPLPCLQHHSLNAEIVP